MSKKLWLNSSRICHWFTTFVVILFFFLSIYILNTYPLFDDDETSSYDIHIITRDIHSPSYASTTSSNYFQYTCASFALFCHKLNLSQIFTIYQFNAVCEQLSHELMLNISTLNPLFILSFRREYFFMLQTNINNIDSHCNHSLIYNIFQPLHESKFHNKKHSILWHTHISKAIGTSAYLGVQNIARLMGMNAKEIEQRIHRDMYGINIGLHIFKGLTHEMQSFNSCNWIYSYLMHTAHKNKHKAPLRVESEAPLTIHKLCPQFYNSIILREPIAHRLSMIAFQNMFDQKRVAIYCRRRDSLHEWRMCTDVLEMNGFLKEVFDNDTNIGKKANMKRLHTQQMIQTIYNQTVLMEYINPKHRHFAIGWQFYKITKKVYMNFNTQQFMGWLTNTYVRWIGYNHKDSSTLIDCMDADYMQINKKHLFNAKQVLLQYDYVLPTYSASYHATKKSRVPLIWKYYAKEIEISILGANNKTNAPLFRHWPTERYLRKTSKEISTASLKREFTKSGELQLLMERNLLDLKLFEFAKQIADADILFINTISSYNV